MEKKREEDLSPEELHARIEEDKKKLARSGVLAFSALVAIIVLCIAWFVSNNKVDMTSGTISADAPVRFELASTGQRQEPESEKLQLNAGTEETETEYYDIEQETEVKTDPITYHVGVSKLAWYLDGQEKISPGSSGQMDLYLIPKTSGLTSATIQMNLEARDADGKKIEDSTLQNLVDGHILLFGKLNDRDGYQKWSGEDQTFTFTPKDGFKEGIPNKVTIYWIWPKYFRNYVYTSRSTQGDLFGSEQNDSYSSMLKFVKEQNNVESKLFYNEGNSITINGEISNRMNDETYNACNDYYNMADEYIGNQTKNIYISATVQ